LSVAVQCNPGCGQVYGIPEEVNKVFKCLTQIDQGFDSVKDANPILQDGGIDWQYISPRALALIMKGCTSV
jgi:hypothetical protein